VRTSRGLDRLITFLDAVVAIAITLLVLPLVDVLGEGAADPGLGEVLSANAGRFGAFLLSFVVIARMWLAHHRIVEHVGAYDPAFLLVNLAWVLTIVFLPFASQVAAVYGGIRGAVAIYVGTIAASSVCLAALAVLVRRRPALRRDGVRPEHVAPLGAVVASGLVLVGLVLGVAVPAVNYWGLLLLVLSGPVERLARRRTAPA
jgi:uncharacterized membrane protein